MKIVSIALVSTLLGAVLATYSNANNSKAILPVTFWMHIQKTSSWLGNFLLLWGCSSIRKDKQIVAKFSADPMVYGILSKNLQKVPCETTFHTGAFEYGYHVPYGVEQNKSTVTLFRNPYNRLISAFLYGKGVHQIMFPLGFPNRAKVKYDLRDKIRKSQYPILTYATLPGIMSCQAKMVLGSECGQPVRLSNSSIAEAQRRIRYDFAFVGLTEESEASARLFLAMYQPNNEDSLIDQEQIVGTLNHAPRMNQAHTSETNMALLHILQQHDWQDRPDEEVYAEAVEVFFERCSAYGISTEHTKAELLPWLSHE